MKLKPEDLEDHPDLYAQVQAQAADAYIAHQRTQLAAVCGDYIAWMYYPPTPHDDPADWAPYWTRLTELVTERDRTGDDR